ncbi:SusC/RagA family TonB-linked outer membrane protein [Dyadobacter flavalbus]|uniref:SusC/RagA family TonB-linked outer membrane protein n=1 Tax=Dyadobacter flavalbus TaxID=2579942 RepID=A0A5M8QVE7_9BACT|nr:SusC/RagA family TonB-linked outer membrane protein [Dyadobacter flavalbus]KAA6439040.1 SusC/RagA family TonB-linked outer membrane protein [Dyadobacter flavalbus]
MNSGFTVTLFRVTAGCMLTAMAFPLAYAGPDVVFHKPRSEQTAVADKAISGKILSKEDNTPVPGVTVVVKGTTNGTTTDVDGKYQINVPESNAVLVFSAVGFATQEKPIGNESIMDIILSTDQKTLEEVVVVGYGTLKKRDLTGAVSQISATKLENENPQSVQDVLRGNIPGMNVGFSASAKGGGNVSVRGTNSLKAGTSPLVVLDGAIYYGGLEDINPNDIETVDVLKDASSAAVFGAKAASGVILVTTKKGKEGKTIINVNTNFGVAEVAKNQPVLSPDGFITWRQEVMRNINTAAQPSRFTNPSKLPSDVTLEQWLAFDGSAGDPTTVWLQRLGMQPVEVQNYKNGKSVDWYSKMFQKALRQDHTVSLSGKTDKVSYYMSLGYLNNEGIVVGDKYSTVRARLNLEGKVNKFLSVGINTQFADRDESQVPVNYELAANLSPWGSEFNPDGTYKWRPNEEASGGNHPYYAPSFTDRDKGSVTINAVVFAKIALPFGISYQANLTPRYEYYHRYNAESAKHAEWAAEGGRASRRDTRTMSWQIDNIFKWNKTFAEKHSIDATFLVNAEKFRMWDDSVSNKGFAPTDVLGYHNMAAGNAPIMWTNDEQSTADALMGRLFYSFKDRYMVTLSTRRDGYSAFGQKNPRALFSSAALGWVFTDEPFFKSSWLSYGKFRVSYGSNGNRDIARYDALSNLITGKYLHINPGGTVYQTSQLYVGRMQNANLKWERTNSLNFGLDFSLFNNVVDGSVELYKSSTRDLLVERALPNVLGFDFVLDNLGQVDNKGLEVSLNSNNMKRENFTWRSTLNFQMNRNKIVHLYGDKTVTKDASGNVISEREADDITNRWFIGHAIDEIWNYKVLGVWQAEEADAAAKYGVKPGDHKILDVNNDGKYTNDDKVFQGFTSPRARITFRNEFKVFKNFDVSFMVYSYLGQKGEFNQMKNRQGFPDRSSSYIFPYWTAENRNNEWARLYSSEGSATGYSVYQSKSFLRFESLAIAYTIPKNLTQKINIQNLRVYGNIRNIGYFSSWSFWDPENGTNNSNNTNIATSVPSPRIFTMGIDITL